MRRSAIVKCLVIVFLVVLCIWQGYLAIAAHEIAALMKDFNNAEGLGSFIVYSQPLVWLFLVLTALIAIDIFRRKDFLVLNSLGVALALAVSTAIIHLFIIVAGYAPIFGLPS